MTKADRLPPVQTGPAHAGQGAGAITTGQAPLAAADASALSRRGVAAHRVASFRRCERGTILPFAVIVLVLLAMMGALAVNTVRFENRRSTMQATLDICVLYAASLKQSLTPKTVFDDCVAKNNFNGTVANVTANKGSVRATGQISTTPFFLNRTQPNKTATTVTATSAAEERVGNVEVSLVLDVSGSMSGTRISSLKTAANEFVATVLNGDTNNRVSITLVPYNGQVNLGPELISRFNVGGIPFTANNIPDVRQSRCVDLTPSLYSTTAIPRTLQLAATQFADTESPTSQVNFHVAFTDAGNATVNATDMWCRNETRNQVLLPDFTAAGRQTEVDTVAERISVLQARINGLTAAGWTSINMGMRWGLAFLDPAARPIFADYAAAGRMPAAYATRPMPMNDPDVLKVVVLMSDGEHYAERRINDGYKIGLSPIFRASDGNYSIRHDVATSTPFWVPHLSRWQATAWSASTARQMPWSEIWPLMRVSYVAWHFYARALGTTSATRTMQYTTWFNQFASETSTTTMDEQLQDICDTARASNIVVYTIAFEAPTRGRTQLSQCATSLSRYYVASSTTIRSVFASIAGNISKLRLTQ